MRQRRDSNRGGCVQSCRHKYQLLDPQTQEKTQAAHIMNAKDLMGIDQIADCIRTGIASLKIEGRMKSNLYVANTVSAYRQAIDYCWTRIQANLPIEPDRLAPLKDQCAMVSNRSFSSGGLQHRPGGESINTAFSHYHKSIQYVGMVRMIDQQGRWVCDVKSGLKPQDQLQVLQPGKALQPIAAWQCYDGIGKQTDQANPNTVVRLQTDITTRPQALLVKAV